VRALAEFGITVVPGTRHFHARNAKGELYTLPAHKGLKSEIDDVYLRGVCRTFGIDLAELKKRL
jgi:hypothetical protein